MPLLEPLTEADAPVYAVMGNHDHAVAAVPELTDALTAAGAVVPGLGADGSQELHVVGLGAAWPNEVDVDAALAGVPDGAPRVVMMHNPTTFDELPAGTAPIALAGHTHCGQVALPPARPAGRTWASPRRRRSWPTGSRPRVTAPTATRCSCRAASASARFRCGSTHRRRWSSCSS